MMNRSNTAILGIVLLAIPGITLSMDYADRLWTPGAIVEDASPKPSPDKYFELHNLIKNPDILTAPWQDIAQKVQNLLTIYPRYISILDEDGRSVLQLLAQLLLDQSLTTYARTNLEKLRGLLESFAQPSQTSSSAKRSLGSL